MRRLHEFRLQSIEGFEPGQRLVIEEIFKEGDLVDVSGTTIEKGFQDNWVTIWIFQKVSNQPV
ncbi:hypothetical protein KFK09_019492 [Dendrobium nobile]|uniref:Uncharacterized protein n=1 Tax=Dendrobium nobile TaxID=94219 RepID=A0A8T3ASA2_DENNO|nr:hypothetical protein KFK09_019492 [Dendrobium nobile]